MKCLLISFCCAVCLASVSVRAASFLPSDAGMRDVPSVVAVSPKGPNLSTMSESFWSLEDAVAEFRSVDQTGAPLAPIKNASHLRWKAGSAELSRSHPTMRAAFFGRGVELEAERGGIAAERAASAVISGTALAPIPVPASLACLLVGIAGLGFLRRRKA